MTTQLFIALLVLCQSGLVFGQTPGIVTIWRKVDLDKRCQAILDFVQDWSTVTTNGVAITKPLCSIRGGTDVGMAWSFSVTWSKGDKVATTQHLLTSNPDGSAAVFACDSKNEKSDACASPSTKEVENMGAVHPKIVDLTAALEAWAGKPVPALRVFGRSQEEWKASISGKDISLRMGEATLKAKLLPKDGATGNSLVELAKPIPDAVVKCLGCSNAGCNKEPAMWRIDGLALTFYRTDAAKKNYSVTWFAQSSVPGPEWYGTCGETRFLIQKL